MAYDFTAARAAGLNDDAIKSYLKSRGRQAEADSYFSSNPTPAPKQAVLSHDPAPTSTAPVSTATPAPQPTQSERGPSAEDTGNGVLNFLGDLTGAKKLGIGLGRAAYNISGQADTDRAHIDQMYNNNQALLAKIKDPNTTPEQKQKLITFMQNQDVQHAQVLNDLTDASTAGLTNKEVVGSAIQTAASFLPVAKTSALTAGIKNPIIKAVASTAAKAAAGATTGYAYDVGSNLANNADGGDIFKPGVGTALGGSLPVVGSLIKGATKVLTGGLNAEQAAAKLREINLRLTPTQKRDISKYGTQTFEELKGLKGNPEQQYATMNARYEDMENQVQSTLEKSNVNFNKDAVLQGIKALKNDAALSADITASHTYENHIDQVAKNLEKKFPGDSIPATELNVIKRAVTKGARNKSGLEITDAVDAKVGDLLTDLLHGNHKADGIVEGGVPGLQELNAKYRGVINARKLLNMARTKNEIGLIGNLAGSYAGGAVGGAVGGPVGTAVGAVIGPKVGAAVAGTRARSAVARGIDKAVSVARTASDINQNIVPRTARKVINAVTKTRKQPGGFVATPFSKASTSAMDNATAKDLLISHLTKPAPKLNPDLEIESQDLLDSIKNKSVITSKDYRQAMEIGKLQGKDTSELSKFMSVDEGKLQGRDGKGRFTVKKKS